MKLFYSKGSCSLAVRIIINELGLASDFIAIDFKTKKTENGDDFYAINPKGVVPTIINEAGDVITENAVILQYLADTNNAHQLLPAIGHLRRYQVLEWLNFVTTEMHKLFGLLFAPILSDEIKEKNVKPIIQGKLQFLNKHLENNHYLAGNEFTLPDAYFFVILRWAIYLFKFDMSTLPHLNAYFARLVERKSIAQSLQQEA